MTKKRTAPSLTLLQAAAGLVGALALSLSSAPALATPEPVHGIAMHGEVKYPPDFSHFDYVNPEAPKGGTLRLSVVANGFDSFNPYVVRGVAAAGVSSYLYDSLLEPSADEPFSEYGLIAESLEVPEDRSYVIFNLREEARFQDGEPITAEDVAFSYRILTTEGHPFYRNYYAEVSDVTVEDSHRVRFDFGDTENRELPLILGQMPILPAHYWQDRDFSSNGLDVPVGSGPYRIGDYEAGRSVTYHRVDDYWARDLGVRKGRFNFDEIRYEYYNDDTVALESFKAGNFDFRQETSAKNWATAYTGNAFDQGNITREAVEHHRPAGMQGFVFNTRKKVFQDRRVREALSYGFDFEWANRNLFFDQYTRTKSYFENSELASSGLPEGRELEILQPFRDQLSSDVFNEPYSPPSTGDSNTLRDNLRQALSLLREAGYGIKDGRMVHQATGEPLSFEVLLFQKSFERVVLPFKRNLERLGIEVTVRLVDSNQYVQRVRNFDFDMITQVLPQSDSPGNEQREYWHSDNADVVGSRNYMGIEDPVVDELVSQVIQAPDRQALIHRVRALDRVLLHGHYVIPHWHLSKDRIAYWNKLKRPEVTPKNGIDLNNWWITP
ncbi:microcin C transport system substrate-binding protein [Marinobacter persicus]|uniref:Microcin C transport system substrate-binding protein n=1 Tax=Marinobacter persicus TaxID=930118 RepID=A0A1I3TW90_9GAMM|nr:extracellular solute-binding protein [Marinobacter persicus]GHD45598.1 ABC transporter [Marinobacter persicus]SFJ75548.1 microcin C transport system substrate-binding protein [Marinobacter persicus]